MTRVYNGGDQLEVLVHQDGSIFHVKDHGNFITQIETNQKEEKPIRSFTCDTIPFNVQATMNGEGSYNPQEMLASAYMILK